MRKPKFADHQITDTFKRAESEGLPQCVAWFCYCRIFSWK